MPIIADISLKKGIRPERPCAVSSIASQVGITCSPIAAAVVSFVTITNEKVAGVNLQIPQVLMITIPACICGIMMAALYSSRRGLDLDKDPKYQARLQDPELREYMFGSTATTLDKKIPATAKASVYLFLAALAVIVVLATFPQLLPHYDGKPLKMNLAIQIVMLTVAGLMVLTCKAEPKKVVAGSVWQAGMVAVVAIYGIAWLSDTYFMAYKEEMMAAMKDIVNAYPWAIAFVLFAVSVLINTQGGVVVAIMPLAYSLGIPWYVLLGSTTAFLASAFINNGVNSLLASLFRKKPNSRVAFFVRSYVSTSIAQFCDNLIFAFMVSYLFFSWTPLQCVTCALTGMGVELLLEILFSFYGYHLTEKWRKEEIGKAYFAYRMEKEKEYESDHHGN